MTLHWKWIALIILASFTVSFAATQGQDLTLGDRVLETSTTTGTGDVTLDGASTGYQSFAVVGDGNTTYYVIDHRTTNEWELGIGTYTAAGTTLSRDTVISSSNSNALVSLSAGTKNVFVSIPASKSVYGDASDNVGIGTASPQEKFEVFGPTNTRIQLRTSDVDGTASYVLENDVQEWQMRIAGSSADRFHILDATNSTTPFRMSAGLGNNEFVIDPVGIGLGDLNPDSPLEILSTTNPQLRISHTDGVDDATLGVDSNGDLTITPSGGDVHFSSSQVGIGIFPSSSLLQIDNRTLDTTGSYVATDSFLVKTAGATDEADDFRGLRSRVRLDQSGGAIGHLWGIEGVAQIINGTVGDGEEDVRGLYGLASIQNGTAGNDLQGAFIVADGDAGTVSGDVRGVDISVDLEAAMTAISGNVYGTYIQVDADEDPVGSVYSLYLNGQSNVDWGVYQNDSADNYFAGNIGLGVTAPSSQLHVRSDASNQIILESRVDAGRSEFQLRRALAGPAIVTNGSILGRLVGQGYDGSAYRYAAAISFDVDGTPGASDMPGSISFLTTPDGSATLAEQMTISQEGIVEIQGDAGFDSDGNGTYDSTGGDLFLGEGQDAAIWYDGTDLQINPQVVGSGDTIFAAGNVGIGDDLDVDGHLAFGTNGTINSDYIVDIDESLTDASASSRRGLNIEVSSIYTADSSETDYGLFVLQNSTITEGANHADVYGISSETQISNGGTINEAFGISAVVDNNTSTGILDAGYGLRARVFTDAVASVTSSVGVAVVSSNDGAATNNTDFWSNYNNSVGATTTTHSGLRVSMANTGTITTTYGIWIDDVIEGTQTNAYAMWVDEGDIILDGDGDGSAGGTDTGSDLFLGEGQDAVIYYDGSDLQINPQVVGSGDTIFAAGNVGIGDTSPDSPLEVLSATDPQLRISHTDGVDDATFGVSADGDLTITTSGDSVLVASRLQGTKGGDVASADEITLGTGNYFDVTGTTQIDHINNTGWQAGAVVILQFDASVTVVHDSATPAGTEASLFLQGAANFSATADDTLTLVYDGVYFRETSRSVN